MTELCFATLNSSPYLGVSPALEALVDATAAAGYTLIALDLPLLNSWTRSGRPLEHLGDRLSESGLRCWELSPLFVTDDATATRASAHALAAAAGSLGATWITVNIHAEESAAVHRNFLDAADIVAGSGSRLALEYVAWHPVNSIRTALAYVEPVAGDRARLLVDSWHHFRGPDTTDDLRALPIDLLAYVQFNDALPAAGGGLREESIRDRTFPGDGVFGLDEWCEILRDKGFDGVVSTEIVSEYWRTRPEKLDEFARRAHGATAAFWVDGRHLPAVVEDRK